MYSDGKGTFDYTVEMMFESRKEHGHCSVLLELCQFKLNVHKT
jgi:hypothetical protein